VAVDIDSTVGPGNYVEVTGVIPGTERPGEEVLLTSHIDHRNSGGNNATGDSVTMEIARALSFLIREGILPKPRRTIRFIWGPEHKGFISYIYHHPEAPNSWLYLINVDMAGKNQSKTGARLHLYRSPHSNPTALDDLVQEVLEWAVAGNRSSIQSRAQMYVWPILDPLGSRDDFLANTVPFWGPSDHEDLNDGSLKVHSVLLNDWPDPFIGAHQDSPETADPTQMKRAAVVVALSLFALANATPHEIEQLAVLSASHAQQRLAAVLRQAILNVSKTDKAALPKKAFDARLALQGALDTELRGLRELDPWLEKNKEAGVHLREISSSLASEGSSLLRDFDSFFRRSAAALGAPLQLPQRSLQEKALRGRIPVRTKSPRGPVNFNRYQYGQAWLAKKLGSWDFLNLDVRRDGQYVPYELLNFVDGRLDLLQIRDAVSAEYGPVPAEHVGAYFDVLVKVGVIEFRSVPESE
jgi:aminopeptidase YwaD